jgi:hypothetical protein
MNINPEIIEKIKLTHPAILHLVLYYIEKARKSGNSNLEKASIEYLEVVYKLYYEQDRTKRDKAAKKFFIRFFRISREILYYNIQIYGEYIRGLFNVLLVFTVVYLGYISFFGLRICN